MVSKHVVKSSWEEEENDGQRYSRVDGVCNGS